MDDLNWHEQLEVSLDQARRRVHFTVPAGTAWLHVRLSMNRNALVFFHVYNERGLLIGDGGFWNHAGPCSLYLSAACATRNALWHHPEEGMYELLVDTPFGDADSSQLGESSPLQLYASVRGGSASGEVLPAGVRDSDIQTAATFLPDGFVSEPEVVWNAEARFYRGDLHGHTDHSDGHLNGEEAQSVIASQGLDFMALTEHNSVPFGQRPRTALMVPAFELTLSTGHLNIFGLRQSSDAVLLWELWAEAGYREPDMATVLARLRGAGRMISLNHMFLRPWEFTATNVPLSYIDTMEILCDPTYPDSPAANDRATAFLDFLWNRGLRLYAVGGSDSHLRPDERYEQADSPSVYGDPSTWVYLQGLSLSTLLEGLRLGHSYVSRHLELEIDIAGGRVLPGEPFDLQALSRDSDADTFSYRVKVTGFPEPLASAAPSGGNSHPLMYTGVFVLRGEVIHRVAISATQPEATLPDIRDVAPAGDWWLRFGILDWEGHVVSFVNPIYSGRFAGSDETIGDLIEDFERDHDSSPAV